MSNRTVYDYVIVGAGSAGCTLANRLSEDPNVSVLLIEAGGSDRSPLITVPLGWGRILFDRLFDWGYFTEAEPHLGGRKVECARGKVLGGSSSINAMAYVRGHRGDYDRWARAGLPGWSYAHVLPYFRKSESWEEGANTWRGGEGPLTTIKTRYADTLLDAWLEAGRAAGYAVNEDYNGAENDGLCRMQWTIRNGRRCSASTAYLRPAMARTNLTVATKALALRVVIEQARACGVEFQRGGTIDTARAAREVIVSGGVINSPQLLMVSGIGDPDHLRQVGIDVQAAVPGVGRNLQDHLSVGLEYQRTVDGPFVGLLRYDRIALAMARAYFFGQGFATEMPGPLIAFLKTRPELAQPDIQFLARFVPPESQPWFPGIRKRPKDAFMCRPVLLHPESRGAVKLRSADPADKPAIFQNFLSAESDWQTLRDGIAMVRDVAGQKPLDPYRGEEIQPGPGVRSKADLDAFIRRTAWTAHHPLGTCKMGADDDPTAVVDAALRVRGIAGLRVVDASVMPDMVGGNINAPVIMIAEKAADLIRGRPLLEAADLG